MTNGWGRDQGRPKERSAAGGSCYSKLQAKTGFGRGEQGEGLNDEPTRASERKLREGLEPV
jgi:hypothetical protein